MALQKHVKVGGSYIKGYQLSVTTDAGNYILYVDPDNNFVVEALELIASDSGSGDYYTLAHVTTTGADQEVTKTLGDTIYNPGPGVGWSHDFPALEYFSRGEALKITYTNAASVPLDVTVYISFVR